MDDLPHWTLSAMKCLANWPKPFRGLAGSDGAMPSYEGFEQDVLSVVKEYFQGLLEPLATFELFDLFVSAYIKAEAVSARSSIRPVKRDMAKAATVGNLMPTIKENLNNYTNLQPMTPPPHFGASQGNYAYMTTAKERMAHVRQTLQVAPRCPSTYR